MTRLALAIVASLCLVQLAAASLAPRRLPLLDERAPLSTLNRILPQQEFQTVSAQGQEPEFQITEQTEVCLDGKACRYEDVPANASIILLELSADNRTIRKVHFRTK